MAVLEIGVIQIEPSVFSIFGVRPRKYGQKLEQ